MGMIGVGYEGIGVDELVAQLSSAGVDVVVDVRLNAISRKRGLSKRALESALAAVGIRYLHEPRLGNPRDNRAAYAEPGTPAGTAARDRFREILSGVETVPSLQEVAELTSEHTVALLCFERDDSHCHRQQVMDAVRETSAAVV